MIKLSQPFISETTIERALEVLKSGNLVQGINVRAFETALENYLGITNAVVVSSGTAALHLALIALELKAGDEVIVPAFTFPATANVVEVVGAKPVLVDISLNDFCIDPDRIEQVITKKTRAIMPVHEFGQAVDMERIMALAEKHHLYVIEDAACALGTEFNNRKAGTFGMAGCFSFHPRKAVTTGEGGVVVTKDDRLASTLRSLRNHGISPAQGTQNFILAGLNYRMTDFQAVIGLGQMPDMDSIISHRIRTAHMLNDALSAISWLTPPARIENRKHVYQTYHVMLAPEINRGKLMRDMNDAGIETNFGAQAIHCLSYYKDKYGYEESDFPEAAKAFFRGLALPMGFHVCNGEIDIIVGELSKLNAT